MVVKQRADRAEDDLKANLHSLALTPNDEEMEDVTMPTPDEEASFRIEDVPLTLELPQRRFNAALAVGMDDKLYIYGGTYEKPGRVEMTLDDFHVIDLGRLDGARELWNRTATLALTDDIDSGDSTTDDDSDSDDNDNGDERTEGKSHETLQKKPQEEDMEVDNPDTLPAEEIATEAEPKEEGAAATTTTAFNSKYPQPFPFESLKSYYDRTAKEWLNLTQDRTKAARREAFVKAETYWWVCREEVREIEEQLEESGIKEVVVGQMDRKEKRR